MTTSVDHTKDLCDQCGAELTMPTDPRHKPDHECGVLFPDLLDYDWKEVFKYADGEWIENGPANGSKPNEPFERTDVVEIIGQDEGENDGASWIMLGRLKSGRFFFIEANCDFTGWGCREGGRSYVSDDVAKIIQFGMSNDDRDRLKKALVDIRYMPPKQAS